MTVIRNGMLQYANATELTIAAGVITVSQTLHTVDTEADAASDDLDTITALAPERGGFVILRAQDAARTVVIKHNTGNIKTPDGLDRTLDETEKTVTLIYDAALNLWLVV